ncbi:hypothetical protein ACFOD0_11725 [Shewanella intestini]|uniref:Uncharacterized protein n=1 Tax=Shewanella intestini TaxID=2017544 RepID=A0ABS5I6S9_9GAMM|nr:MULTISPECIES: hypothetical protein [Shewanella]MBR9729621.1 hypothetical protein [Shewanella intestini]MRG37691.1 hypothetical protein [Shewanella sp. XMDDZSB0408]
MSVIRSVANQWDQAEYAQRLEVFLLTEKPLQSFFVGATTLTTVCNLIAAMVNVPPKNTVTEITLEQAFDSLSQCFLLLFVKEIEHQTLSQPEQLILSITHHFAQQLTLKPQQHPTELINQAQQTINAMGHLDTQRQAKRKANSNMCNH